MIELFTYDFEKEKDFNAKKYLEKLIGATKKDRLYVARSIDYEDKLYYEVAKNKEETNVVSVINVSWDKYDVHKIIYKYQELLDYIKNNKGKQDIFETEYEPVFASTKHFLLNDNYWQKEWEEGNKLYPTEYYNCPSLCEKYFKNRINRLSKLFEINAPEIIVNKEKQSLFECMVFYYCASRYHDVKLENDYHAIIPEKGRVDVENEKFVVQFLELYQNIAQYVKDNIEVTTIQIQRQFKIGYSFMVYALDMLEDNCLVVEWQGRFKDTGLTFDEASEIVIDTKPFKRDTKFLDQLNEQELLDALEKLRNKKNKGGV